MKALFSLIISGALVVSGYAQTRNVLVGTNNAVVQPTNFWSADASNARTGLGLGTAATNPASAFQPASSSLTNLVSGNGGALTNLQATNLVGLIPTSNIPPIVLTNIGTITISQGGTGATNAANARQNLGSTTVGDALFIATDAASARTTIGATTVGSSVFTLVNPSAITFLRLNADNTASALSASDFRTALSLGTAATNPSSAFQPASSALTNLSTNNGANLTNIPVAGVVGALSTNGNGAGLTNLTAANITGTVGLASNVTGTIAISNGGSGATTAGGARTNLGLGATNTVQFENIVLNNGNLLISNGAIYWDTNLIFEPETTTFETQVSFTEAAATRTNLGLGWSALTNTTASGFQTALFGTGTNPVLVNTNGEVVSPTNFWQAAPITTTFIESEPNTNSSTNIAAARFLHIHSLATNIVNVTNTIVLPTNGSTFVGDVALVVHQGPTNSMTRVRTAGSTNDLVTMTRFDEAVEFVYYDNVWQFNHNNSFIEPIYFSGTNAAANAAASRTNLGLGNISTNGSGELVVDTNLVVTNGTGRFTNLQTDYFEVGDYIFVADSTNTNTIVFEIPSQKTNFTHGLGLGPTNNVQFNYLDIVNVGGANNIVASFVADGTPLEIYTADEPFSVGYGTTNFGIGVDSEGFKIKYGTNSTDWGSPVLTDNGGTNLLQPSNVTNFRTAIGIPLPALTNTNNAGFQRAIFQTNTTPAAGANLGDAKAWIEISVVTNSVTNSYRIPVFQ